MYLDGLEPLDQKIMALLTANARLSYSEIGEQVGVSRVAVRSHIEALERRGVIEGYTTVVNPQKLNGSYSLYLELETEPAALTPTIAHLRESAAVTQLYRMTGECCLHVHAVAPSQAHLEDFLAELDTLQGIRKLQNHVILERLKDVKGLRL